MRADMYNKYQSLWIGALALIIVPILLQLLGLTTSSSTDVVIYAIAAMGLNLLVGYTGLTSFGHGAWFGVGAYAAALSQKYWFPGQIVAPMLFTIVFIAASAAIVGFLILRRRGVYFSLLTLALSALTFAIAFRWTDFTGGESGLGNVVRPVVAGIDLDQAIPFLVFVSVIALIVLFVLQRVIRSPFGHTIVAIRENEQRARFQGYSTIVYKLIMFIVSASVTGLAGALLAFHHRFASAEPTSVAFSGELLAMVVIGGMRSFLGPALGALFFILFSPTGLVGIWQQIKRRLRPPAEVGAAMSQRQIVDGLPLPAFLQPPRQEGLVLEVKDIDIRFGGIQAVKNAQINLHAGEIHALIGPNGAGKTTTFNLISGMFIPNHGTVKLNGEEIQGLTPGQICQRGLARSFQITNLFKGLSISENLRLSLQARHASRFNMWKDIDAYPEIHAETEELMRFLGLKGIDDIEGGALSYGGQRLVDLGIALGSKPHVLLMDEPLAGLAAAERERVSRLVKIIADNIPVLIVEHDIDRVLGFSHQVTVMNQGSVLMSGTPDEARADQRVQEIYTGTGTPPVTDRVAGDAQERPQLLSFDKVNAFYGKSHILNDATLEVREGEIVALLGRNGAGKSTLLKALTGLLKPASGAIRYNGKDIAGLSAPDIARLGIGYVPQGRGLFAGMTVAENLSLGRLARKTDSSNGIAWSEEKILHYFPRLKERLHTPADSLSGGEQQMVAVARALSGNVRLLLLDEPFEGLAPAVVQELFTVFDQLRKEVSIVIVEHNLDLVLALADRVFALERGAVFHTGPAEPLLTDLTYRKQILWL